MHPFAAINRTPFVVCPRLCTCLLGTLFPLRLGGVLAVGQFSCPLQEQQGHHQTAGQRKGERDRHRDALLAPSEVQCGHEDDRDQVAQKPHDQARRDGSDSAQGPPLVPGLSLWPRATDYKENTKGARGEEHREEQET